MKRINHKAVTLEVRLKLFKETFAKLFLSNPALLKFKNPHPDFTAQ